MSNEYRIAPAGSQFIVIDDAGERVGTYSTEEAAKQEIERCMKEDAMYAAAKQLVDAPIRTHMEQFGVAREEASYWICSASEVV
jgi:hypothetical protein